MLQLVQATINHHIPQPKFLHLLHNFGIPGGEWPAQAVGESEKSFVYS